MGTYVALLRGINVGGRNTLPMKELRALLADLGCRDVKTYIQSGNVVFRSARKDAAKLSNGIAREIKSRRGFEPHVLVFAATDFAQAVDMNPFPDAASDPKSLHLGFLDTMPGSPDLEKLGSLKSESERCQLRGRVFYLHAPDGVARSKLAANAEKSLGVSMTDRNWRTVGRIMAMLEEVNR